MEFHFSGKRSLPRPSGVLSAVYFVKYEFKIVASFPPPLPPPPLLFSFQIFRQESLSLALRKHL